MRNKHSSINEVSDFVTSSGEEFRTVYSAKKLPNGLLRLTESDRINIKDEINSHKDSCDLSILVDRIYRGDTSLLGNPNNGYYGDVSEFPQDFRELLDLVSTGKTFFEALPAEERNKFADFGDFVNSVEFVSGAPDPVPDEKIQESKGDPE